MAMGLKANIGLRCGVVPSNIEGKKREKRENEPVCKQTAASLEEQTAASLEDVNSDISAEAWV